MNKFIMALTTCSAILLPISSQANFGSSNTIYFAGEVVSETCQVSINDNTENPIVLLPSVTAADLASAGATAGETTFTLSLSGCSGSAKATATRFVGNNVDADGNLVAPDAGAVGYAKNVALQLLDAPGGNPVNLSTPATVDGVILADGDKEGRVEYAVQYVSVAGNATAGIVTGSVQYSVTYF
ncbi:type 1 fimbrial protein [Shewanella algae]|uniref:fimbrial protein n=1 Tax=Shewanella algae TaxID=38313 RepID=UPI001AACD065|nr:fimbrial protein [Shewanella algae]MBO2605427.1 type 1 fimbrial protein [Shewanella algae]